MIIVVGGKVKNDRDKGANIGDGVGERHWCRKRSSRRHWRCQGNSRGRGCRGGGGFGDESSPALEVAGGRQRWRGGRSHTLNPRIDI